MPYAKFNKLHRMDYEDEDHAKSTQGLRDNRDSTPNVDKNDMALSLLFQSIPKNLILQVGELDSAKQVLEAIRTRHVGAERVKEARLQTLMNEFDRLKMKDTDRIDAFEGDYQNLH